MIGSNSISNLLQSKKSEKEYYSAMEELKESEKALFYTSAYYQHDEKPILKIGALKEWAVGSYLLFGDRPF